MCHEYRVPQWEEPMRLLTFQLPSLEHVGYVVKSEIINGNYYFLTNKGIEIEFQDVIAGSKIKISYNGYLTERLECNDKGFIINTDCLHKIFINQVANKNEKLDIKTEM